MLSDRSRSFNIVRNAGVAILCQIITIILGFACRKVLIDSMGLAYVGVNTLFTSIISLLSFVELGIGNAIVYSLYKPLADNDINKISSLVAYYKRIYIAIGLSVLTIGTMAIPFLPYLVHVEDGIREDVTLMYLLSLLATGCTYFYAAPKTLLIADQKQYIEKLIYQFSHIVQVVIQIIVLFVLKDYYAFLIIQVICALFNNILSHIYVHKKYPYITQLSSQISSDDKQSLFKDVRAMFLYKVGSSFLNYASNIFISYFCGLIILGKISNYMLILGVLSGLITQITSSFSASIGNKTASESKDACRETFSKALFLSVWAAGLSWTGFILFSDSVVTLLFGVDSQIEFAVLYWCATLYWVQDVHSISTSYRYALGVFREGRYAPLFASCINIVFSFVGYYFLGVKGLYIAPIISRILTLGIVDSYLISGSRNGVLWYFLEMTKYFLILSGILIVSKYLLSHIDIYDWGRLILYTILYIVVFNFIWIMIYYRTDNFKYIYKRVNLLCHGK